MEPNLYFALSSGFPQIVSLLAAFYSINEGKTDLEEFKAWLDTSNNEYAIKIIENNTQLQNTLSSFISNNHEDNVNKLSHLTDEIVRLANKIEGLDKIASSFGVSNDLSQQAIDVLRQFVNSKSPKMHHMNLNTIGEYQHVYILEGADDIQYEEPIFIEDDIQSLVDRNLITKKITNKGNIIYSITRQAVSFIETINK
ncbi:hypothetical protein ACTXKV_05785 [Psychrobacter cibarius]|uniref:hypothetical protein n=1 Tax=Psychrobacter cibarius TaxID=282669 RepID=UPI003FD48C31